MSTKALDVKKALRDMLAVMPMVASDAIQVTYGFPVRSPERKWAVVGKVAWDSEEWATNRSRQEVFTVAVAFNVQLSGGNSEQSEEYVAAMAAAFEDALKADPGLGGLCVTTGFEPRTLNSWPIDQAYEAQFEAEVTATCRP